MALYDITAANRQAVQSGLALGQAMFSNSLRMQELESRKAMQRLQEQQAAETLKFALWQHNQMIDAQAANAKSQAAFQSMITPTLTVPAPSTPGMSPMIGPDGGPMGVEGEPISGGTMQIKNPNYVPDMGEAFIRSQMGNPHADLAKTMATGGALALHQAQAEKAKADAARFSTGISYAPGGMEKDLTYLQSQLDSGEITQSQFDAARNVKLGIAPRGGLDQRKLMFDRYSLRQQEKMLDILRKERLDLYNKLPTDANGNKIVPDDIVTELAKKAGLSQANITKLEGEEIGSENVFAIGRELLPLINENTTGAKAEVKRFLQRRGITTLFPSLDDPELSVAEAVGRRFSAGVVRALRSDSNIGIREQEALQHAAETINWTTMASGRAKLANIVKQAADTSRRAAQTKGTPINPLFLTRGEIRARLAAGDFGDPSSPEAANAAIAAFNNTAESFLQQINTPAQ